VAELGLSDARLRRDGAVVVHSDETGYRAVTRLSSRASELHPINVHGTNRDEPAAKSIKPGQARRDVATILQTCMGTHS